MHGGAHKARSSQTPSLPSKISNCQQLLSDGVHKGTTFRLNITTVHWVAWIELCGGLAFYYICKTPSVIQALHGKKFITRKTGKTMFYEG